jgi:hypothetical protein
MSELPGNANRTVRLMRAAGCAVAAAILAAAISGAAAGERPEKLSPEELTGLLDISGRSVHYGSLMISAGDTISGPLIVIYGSLDLQDGALVAGDAWVINGRLIMTGRSAVEGMVHLVNSDEFRSRDAVITAGVEEYRCECRLDDAKYEEDGTVSFVEDIDPRTVRVKIGIAPGRPTRVDYEVLRVGLVRKNDKQPRPYVKGYAFLQVPFWKSSGGFLGFDARLEVPLAGEELGLILGGFKRTETNDAWMLDRLENGFFTMMTGDDFLDYWERRGGELGLRWRPAEKLALTATASLQEDVSLEAEKIPSLLRSTGSYRPNPGVLDGTRLAFDISLVYDGREDETWRRSAWRADLVFESGVDAGPGEISYDLFEIELARYQYLPALMRLDLRGRLFSSFGPIPPQATRALGGYGGLRGTRNEPFAVVRGDRLALVSVELRRRLPDLPYLRSVLTRWCLLAFTDIGLLDEAEQVFRPLDFLDAPAEAWRTTVGLGISGESFMPYLGLYVAQDLDRDRFEPRVILRFERSF